MFERLPNPLEQDPNDPRSEVRYDSRKPDYTKKGVFIYYSCYRCKNGEKACVRGNPRQCEHLRAA
jgi:hypothetical protein